MKHSPIVLLFAVFSCGLRAQRVPLPPIPLSPEVCRTQADAQVPKWRAAGMSDRDVEKAYQVVIGQCTGDFDIPTAVLIASVNVDMQRLARMFLSGALDSAGYLARARDRGAKLHRALKDAAYRNDLVNFGDRDGDLVPDNRDRCTNTADLAPTDVNGCPMQPNGSGAPDAQSVRQILQSMNFVADVNCTNAPVPETPRPVKAAWGEHMGNFAVSRVGNEPAGCLVLYQIEMWAQGTSLSNPLFAEIVFRGTEAKPSPAIPATVLRFQTSPGDPGDAGNRKTAAIALLNYSNARWRVRAINGSGLRSQWSEWRTLAGPPTADPLGPFTVP